jgi:hypothetical protein
MEPQRQEKEVKNNISSKATLTVVTP